MPIGSNFQLRVRPLGIGEKQFDHFILPKPIGPTDGRIRWGISMKGRIDVDSKGAIAGDSNVRMFILGTRRTVPVVPNANGIAGSHWTGGNLAGKEPALPGAIPCSVEKPCFGTFGAQRSRKV
jgi:hypothetical protein